MQKRVREYLRAALRSAAIGSYSRSAAAHHHRLRIRGQAFETARNNDASTINTTTQWKTCLISRPIPSQTHRQQSQTERDAAVAAAVVCAAATHTHTPAHCWSSADPRRVVELSARPFVIVRQALDNESATKSPSPRVPAILLILSSI